MNLFSVPAQALDSEVCEALIADKGILIERIVSVGQVSPPDFWYDQERDEWVVVLQGNAILGWEDGSKAELKVGDWVLIPAYKKHRVEYTSTEPPCLWLAVHGDILGKR